ncbi:hypothetical protein CLAIMM_14706 isoform 2 [Cladophialophora immunda]|nr:hypothetical protein CLAIMM_14706 isoform 1 [Cladophialophora immunda]OQV10763.1 hypothetical protein CLAIMM_14706 isoform 2 [Cladophialophora immunda]
MTVKNSFYSLRYAVKLSLAAWPISAPPVVPRYPPRSGCDTSGLQGPARRGLISTQLTRGMSMSKTSGNPGSCTNHENPVAIKLSNVLQSTNWTKFPYPETHR